MSTRLALILASAATATALAACTPGGDQGGQPVEDGTPSLEETVAPTADDGTGASEAPAATQPPVATQAPAGASLEPGEEVPDGMDVHDVRLFQVAIPSEWTPAEQTDEPTLAFWGQERDGAPAEGAMLRWDPQGSDAADEAARLKAELEAEGTSVQLMPIDWPDVDEGGAVLATFDSEMAPGAMRHVRQVFADLPQGGTGTVIGFAEPDAFDSSRVPEVLGSFRVAP
ncbi:hypothetical protein [Ornithinimicrobium panacihumi]|uniref:hypothetical protein n=1 Tax=Ornithinimicrobium panacihumi TaxID=2008449 RepID=UPI003F8903B0